MARDNQRELPRITDDESAEWYFRETGTDGSNEFGELMDDASDSESFTLESILAEYKGTAYIDGDKRTPPSVLQARTNQIVQEVTGRLDGKPGNLTEPLKTENSEKPVDKTAPLPKVSENMAPPATIPEKTTPLPRISEKTTPLPKLSGATGTLPKSSENTAALPGIREATVPLPKVDHPAGKKGGGLRKAGRKAGDAASAERDVIAFDQYKPAGTVTTHAAEVETTIEKQQQFEEDTISSVGKAIGLFNRHGARSEDDELYDGDDNSREEAPVVEEEVFEEPDFRVAIKRFADGCNTYSMRSFVSLVLSAVMALLTFVFQSGVSLPFGLGSNRIVFNGILLILLFVVMALSIDKLIQGFVGFVKGGPGLESLNLMSCLMTAASAAYSIISKDAAADMPYCVISAFSLTFTLWGEKIYYKALTETMKTALSVANPYGVIAEMCPDLDKTVIKKVPGRTSGFYNNLVQADISEVAYKYASPILIVAAAALGFYASLGHGLSQHVLRNIAAVMAAAAPFSAMMTFAVPFSAVTRRARNSGAAIAGWGGADDIFHSDGASITDEDLFPPGTITLGGIKVFEEVQPEKALRYTGSLIIASNCGLTKLFSENMSKQGMSLIRVDDFACYEGGIGASIRGERVIAGSAGFMNLMGIRIPASLNVKNAIFTAVEKKLIAVFTINYVPVKSVQNALFSVLRYNVKLFFAMRDFNITPVMLEQKFRVPVDAVEYMPIQNSYDISDASKHEAKRVAAILTRDGLGPFVEAITAGRRLRSTVLINTIFSLFTAVFGMLLMFVICWTGAAVAASASNLLLYMLAMLLAVLLISGFARFRQ